MDIVEGKYYRTRNDKVVGPMNQKGEDYGMKWNRHGVCIFSAVPVNGQYDITRDAVAFRNACAANIDSASIIVARDKLFTSIEAVYPLDPFEKWWRSDPDNAHIDRAVKNLARRAWEAAKKATNR